MGVEILLSHTLSGPFPSLPMAASVGQFVQELAGHSPGNVPSFFKVYAPGVLPPLLAQQPPAQGLQRVVGGGELQSHAINAVVSQ